eukprot:TRINITY_DN16564_c0_g1_i1.p1 TRINITY_DN16564_c0_g1~~TRINITY_DN16564_c0_g1_i1.p1  ORF type:complete len:225 (+),score=35.39 TRINITY_DN16564_c0_g1_i1:51-677(+)
MIQDKIREARLLVHNANMLLEDLELDRGVSDIQTQVETVSDKLTTILNELKVEAEQETSSKRELVKRLVLGLVEEDKDVKGRLQRYKTAAYNKNLAAKNRAELMKGANAGMEDRTSQQYLAAEANNISSVSRSLDNIVGEGDAVLQALKGHTSILQSTQQKLYSYLESMQLSGSILTTIQRTTRTDSIILYGGMFIITSMLIIIYWFK